MMNMINEKVRAGQPYLYRKNGLPSEVYEVRFTEYVDDMSLNTALQSAIERYPYFKVRYREQDGDFFTVPNELPIEGLSRKGFTLPETKGDKAAHRRYELRFPQEEFMKLCKSKGGSPVTILSIMMSRAIHGIFPDSGVINSNFPVDVRRELGVEGTYKNCVKSISLPYGDAESAMTDEQLCAHYKELMNAQRAAAHCRAEFNNIIMLLNAIDHLHSYRSKRSIMRFLDDLKLDTYLISYIGQFNFGENESHIDSVHLYSDCSLGLVMNMTCACGYFTIDFVQDFEENRYVSALAEEFARENVTLEVSDMIEFATPCDTLMRDMTYPDIAPDTQKTLWQKTVEANLRAYRMAERAAVTSMTAVSDGFVKLFLMHDDETLQQAKQRLNAEQTARAEKQYRDIMTLGRAI